MEQIFELASNISTPLALGGLFAAVLFFTLRKILEKDIFPSLTRSAGADILKLIIDRLFILALIAMIFGFMGYVISMFLNNPTETAKIQVAENSEEATSKYVFVTSEKFPSNFGGLATADLICTNLASKSGLRGEYKAWLSDSQVGPADRFRNHNANYMLPSGKVVIASLSSIFDCDDQENCLLAPINENENGIPVQRPSSNSPQNRLWTATGANGYPAGNSCENWTSNEPAPEQGLNNNVVLLGDPMSLSNSWSASYSANCNDLSLRLYCFEQ